MSTVLPSITDAKRPAGGEPVARILPEKRIGTTLFGYIVLAAFTAFAIIVAFNPNFHWQVVREYLFNGSILFGVLNTLLLTILSMALGIVIGIILAIMNLAPARQLNIIAAGYIWFFRGVPLLVQLLFWFNLAALFPNTAIGIPGTPLYFALNINALITPFTAAVLALSLHEGAYMAEIVRSGIMSIERGQREAAEALSMTPGKIMWRIILPQAMRVIIPPTGNQVISMLKTTSLVSVIALSDLLYSTQTIYSLNYQVIPLLLVASIWYLFMVSILTLIQRVIERHFDRANIQSRSHSRQS